MKRLSLLFSVSVLGLGVLCAQTVGLQQVNQYAKQQYKSQWKSAAMSILPVLDLNEQGGYTYSTTIGMPNHSKAEVYESLSSKLGQIVDLDTILIENMEQGVFCARTYLYSVSNQVGGFYRFHLCLHPVIQLTAKDNEAELEISLQYYEIVKTDKGIVQSIFNRAEGTPLPAEQWLVADRYPYNERGKMPLATAEAFTKSYALIQLLVEQLKK